MNIEFQTPSQGLVKEWILKSIRDKLVEFHQRDKEISKATVCFKEQAGLKTGEFVCEILLTIFGDSLFVHRSADSFEQAARLVLTELSEKVDKIIKQRETPDEITSTVKV
ncbi:MAG: hypothetical protein Q8918_19350 [Bacteroidota bacterium]|nr:hypothetical protein [Bacteroidota bacterium]